VLFALTKYNGYENLLFYLDGLDRTADRGGKFDFINWKNRKRKILKEAESYKGVELFPISAGNLGNLKKKGRCWEW
jgi:translation elongation factor EF-1alpha